MYTYSIEEARKIVMNCSKQYDKKLKGKIFLILYRERDTNIIKTIEVQFEAENYQHLTGIELVDSGGQVRRNVASLFYVKCVNNTLRKDEIKFKDDGTTHLKLLALPTLIDIHKITKITGDYNNNRTYLIADKLIGNVNFCLGLKQLENQSYVPVSALLKNIKELSSNQSQVLAIFSKNKTDNLYTTIRYVTKGINLNTLNIASDTLEKIDLTEYVPKT